ncbi:hypothetical protein DXG03_006981 [Asterophora parasitica]|uniref:Uncharacterized protein n=1 Tax=Asterophora parasitica TaxID=117018 RepID=A0A9P7GJ11_9AGAR|nr:hypothetical protein DXG03_006981 [Asterophora parasitica]
MAVHVLVWSQDLWVVPNPYANATSFPPDVPPLGPSSEYRDAMDFCWTTTMKRNQVNYAPIVIVLAAIVTGPGFRRGWGTYESTYLFAKLSTLFIIAVINPENCFFRSMSSSRLPIVRQVLLLLCTVGFFVAQCVLGPFLDPVNNASEWTSRLNYLSTSTVALIVVLDVPAKNIFNTYVLYTSVARKIYIIRKLTKRNLNL